MKERAEKKSDLTTHSFQGPTCWRNEPWLIESMAEYR